jgi:hypothetical protein
MRVRDVSVRIERVLSMPHDARLLIDEPPGEDLVVWALADLPEAAVAAAVDRYLLHRRPTRGGWTDGRSLFAS